MGATGKSKDYLISATKQTIVPSSFDEIKSNIAILQDSLGDSIRINNPTDENWGKINKQSLLSFLSGFRQVLNIYPDALNFVQNFVVSDGTGASLTDNNDFVFGVDSFKHTIGELNDGLRKNDDLVARSIRAAGFHEATHLLEYAAYINSGFAMDYTLREFYDSLANQIIDRHKAHPDDSNLDFITRTISPYASHNGAEAFAEAVCQVYQNRNQATPLAREMYNILIYYLGQGGTQR